MNRIKLLNVHLLTSFERFGKGFRPNIRKWPLQGQTTRGFNRVLAPIDEDLSPISKEEIAAYQNVMTRYEELSKQSLEGGGLRGIERHVKKNKKILVRDRIKMLLDPETFFLEIGHLAGFEMEYGDIPAAGLVCGIGRVAGTYCMIGGNDATVKAGTYFPITIRKSLRTQTIAEENRLPSVYLPDSGGAYLPLQSEIFISGGRSFYNQATMSSKGIPQISVVCGSCTAGGAYNPTMCDEAINIDKIGKIYLGGPPLVKAALGEIVSEEDLGGAFMHSTVSGITDYFAQNENEAFEMCRDVVEGLNLNNVVPIPNFNEPLRQLSSWNNFAARDHLSKCDIYATLSNILDGSQFKEFKAFYGPGLIVGLGYMEGMLLGIVANVDNILSAEALKSCHFLDMCNRRSIPVLFLQNSPPPGSQDSSILNEINVLRDRGKMSAMVATLQVPKVALTLTACYEEDSILMCGPSFKPNLHFMWPSSKLSSLEMTSCEIESDSHDGKSDAFTAAFHVLTDAIILPENTRKVVAECLRILQQQTLNPSKDVRNPVFRI